MSATLSLARPTVLVIHDDGEALDVLTRLFEAGSFEVITAVTGFRAQAHLEGDRPIDVVVVPWDAAHPVGGEVYRWIAQTKPRLAERVVFLADEEGEDATVVAPGRPMFRKGQDSHALVAVLREIARQAHGDAATR